MNQHARRATSPDQTGPAGPAPFGFGQRSALIGGGRFRMKWPIFSAWEVLWNWFLFSSSDLGLQNGLRPWCRYALPSNCIFCRYLTGFLLRTIHPMDRPRPGSVRTCLTLFIIGLKIGR